MRKTLLIALAGLLALLALPVTAQAAPDRGPRQGDAYAPQHDLRTPDRPFRGPVRDARQADLHEVRLRLRQQEAQIDQAQRFGQLDRREHRTLTRELTRIRVSLSRSTRDGRLTRVERIRLDRMLDSAERSLRVAMRDGRRPGGWRG